MFIPYTIQRNCKSTWNIGHAQKIFGKFPYFFFKRFYLFFHETEERERGRETERQREKQALRREPDMGLDSGSPGSRPGPKADA